MRPKQPSRVADIIAASPAGMTTDEVAAAMILSRHTVRAHLHQARDAGLIFSSSGNGNRWSRWVTQANYKAALMWADAQMEATRAGRAKRQWEREKAAALKELDEAEDMPLNQRIVSAAEAKPLRVKAVRSVFELGAM